MYLPKHFAEPRVDVLQQLIYSHPLSTLVTLTAGGLEANHIPLHLSPQPEPYGTLRGHVARANPIWRTAVVDCEALAIFHGPDAYITPAWYPGKTENGKVVPTWNYAVAHAYGALRVIDDPAWLRDHLEELTAHNEAAFPQPWHLDDAPAEFIEQRISAIVGIEIVIGRLIGKWKISQNQPTRNQQGVVRGLRESNSQNALQMAALVATVNRPADPQ